jgi:hypothetical protein
MPELTMPRPPWIGLPPDELYAWDAALASAVSAAARGEVTLLKTADGQWVAQIAPPENEPGLALHVAIAVNTARTIYAFSGDGDRASAHADLIWAMAGPGVSREGVFAAITTGFTEDHPLAQAARDALMPYACFDCGTEVDAPGQEPDHFGWCPGNKDQESRT